MLTYYLTQTKRLLQNPGAPTSLYSDADLTSYINTMRARLAGESRCIHSSGAITVTINQREYLFSDIAFADTGIAGTLNARSIAYAVPGASGSKWVTPRGWAWFNFYSGLNNPIPPTGVPRMWSQSREGTASKGTITNGGAATVSSGAFMLDPLPDFGYSLTVDCICYPIALAADADAESIPYMWTDGVPFGAAWMALLSAQTSQRMGEAEKYLSYFQMYSDNARRYHNPDVVGYQYFQSPNVALPNLLGSQGGKQ